MYRQLLAVRILSSLIFCMCCALAEAGIPRYFSMAPIAQYRMSRAAEIALARSAAPASIAGHARVLVLGPGGYRSAAAGANGFVCLVVRSWDLAFSNREFWNPKIRAPQCFNSAAARSVLPRYLDRTQWVLAGDSIPKMRALSRASRGVATLDPAPGSMCYMMSEGGYLNDVIRGPWRPHVMFFEAGPPAAKWGANLAGSPLFADSTNYRPVTIFMVVVPRWSNGTWAGRGVSGGGD